MAWCLLCCVSRADPGWDWYRALKLLCKEMVGDAAWDAAWDAAALQGWGR